MDDEQKRTALVRHWKHAAESDQIVAHEIYSDDVVLEFPQSGERFVGVDNVRTWRARYPTTLDFQIRNIRGGGDFWVAENAISYDGEPWNFTVSILEFRGDRVAHETIYITDTWEPAEWRRPWWDGHPARWDAPRRDPAAS